MRQWRAQCGFAFFWWWWTWIGWAEVFFHFHRWNIGTFFAHLADLSLFEPVDPDEW